MATRRRRWLAWLQVSLLLIWGCVLGESSSAAKPLDAEDVVVVAHRGASGVAPENTLAAYRVAIERGLQAAECDVRLSADGHLVLMHDETVERTTTGTGEIAAMSLQQLRELDAGRWRGEQFAGEQVPTLEQALDLTRGKLRLLIEIKAGHGAVPRIARLLKQRPEQDVMIISFYPRRIQRAKQYLPKTPAMVLIAPPEDDSPINPAVVGRVDALGADAIGFDHRTLVPDLVRRAHEAGLEVYTWTVNNSGRARQLVRMGVDGLITDYPFRVETALGRKPGAR